MLSEKRGAGRTESRPEWGRHLVCQTIGVSGKVQKKRDDRGPLYD
jgi:hypothetical protein